METGRENLTNFSMNSNPKLSALQQLQAKIIEVVPEIMQHFWKVDNLAGANVCINCWEDEEAIEKDIECCGRPIRLEDVLLALEDSIILLDEDYPNELCEIQVSRNGEFSWYKIRDPDDGIYKTGVSWNLHKNLEEQSPETINFLHKLLCE
ncbi:MAG: hypothetical protein ACE5D4_08785 [Thermodesulfobacteriota bacterium]